VTGSFNIVRQRRPATIDTTGPGSPTMADGTGLQSFAHFFQIMPT
jgi:hypothetical protein